MPSSRDSREDLEYRLNELTMQSKGGEVEKKRKFAHSSLNSGMRNQLKGKDGRLLFQRIITTRSKINIGFDSANGSFRNMIDYVMKWKEDILKEGRGVGRNRVSKIFKKRAGDSTRNR
mmetsp:Transcript_32665/g.79466  ORF Transcript_32665/g.79466 Transcript_32665/m.79466 type:complete len:118 (-) Transcript_32665:260-613(-)